MKKMTRKEIVKLRSLLEKSADILIEKKRWGGVAIRIDSLLTYLYLMEVVDVLQED